jgi:hypothetical protein
MRNAAGGKLLDVLVSSSGEPALNIACAACGHSPTPFLVDNMTGPPLCETCRTSASASLEGGGTSSGSLF